MKALGETQLEKDLPGQRLLRDPALDWSSYPIPAKDLSTGATPYQALFAMAMNFAWGLCQGQLVLQPKELPCHGHGFSDLHLRTYLETYTYH